MSLLQYCRHAEWAGHDPYDALNSTVFKRTPLYRSRLCRLALTQAVKRSPVNLRPVLRVPKQQNPKGLALFCSALLKIPGEAGTAAGLLEKLMKSRSAGRPYMCWGYNFAWQNRVTFVPRGEPNIICTTFAGNALLDGYDILQDDRYLDAALNASEFLYKGLHITGHGDEICFSYTPRDREQIHNANLLGAAFLARLYEHTGNPRFLGDARAAARFSVMRQAEDGSWPYGESPAQQWIDNFHTGYNLTALKRIAAVAFDGEFNDSLRKGFEFYITHFFEPDGTPKYYHDETYPIDIHAVAQSIITLVEFADFRHGNLTVAQKVFEWAWNNMRDRNGYFYFQKRRLFTNKNSYMRWAQAWMLVALVTLAEALVESGHDEGKSPESRRESLPTSALAADRPQSQQSVRL